MTKAIFVSLAVAAVVLMAGHQAIAGEPSPSLTRGIKLYEDEKFAEAIAPLQEVASGATSDDENGRQRAQFYLGKALYNLKRYDDSLAALRKITDGKSTSSYYGKAAMWLFSLFRFVGEATGIEDLIVNLDWRAIRERVDPWLKPLDEACDGGNGRACWLLGKLYQGGLGVVRDEARWASYQDRACQGTKRGCPKPPTKR